MGCITWHATQLECPDFRNTHSHLTQGTCPSKRLTKVEDIKRYLRVVTVDNDGLLDVTDNQPDPRERTVIAHSVVDGLLTALHIRFNHPSRHQIKHAFNRYFFAIDIDRAVVLKGDRYSLLVMSPVPVNKVSVCAYTSPVI